MPRHASERASLDGDRAALEPAGRKPARPGERHPVRAVLAARGYFDESSSPIDGGYQGHRLCALDDFEAPERSKLASLARIGLLMLPIAIAVIVLVAALLIGAFWLFIQLLLYLIRGLGDAAD